MKKLLSMILAVVLLLSLMIVPAYAQDAEAGEDLDKAVTESIVDTMREEVGEDSVVPVEDSDEETVSPNAAGDNTHYETEPNNGPQTANTLYHDYTMQGNVTGTDMDWYVFTVPQNSTMKVTLASYNTTAGVTISLWNSAAQGMLGSAKPALTSGFYTTTLTKTLTAGVYYLLLTSETKANITYMLYFESSAGGGSGTGNLAITSHPVNMTVKETDTAVFSVTASGTGLTYQWQYKAPNGSWTNLTGGTASYIVFSPAELWRNGYQYRCVVKDQNNRTVTSNPATLYVQSDNSVRITVQPQSKTVKANESVTFSVTAAGTGLTYQWQFRPANGSWSNAASTSASITFNPAELWRNGYQYRCVVRDWYGNSVTSNAATLTVQAATAGPKITAQPQNKTVKANESVTFTVAATGEGLTYQWQFKAPNGSWNNNNIKTASITFNPAEIWRNGYQYRCIVTDKNGSKVTSNAATLTVQAVSTVKITTQPQNKTVKATESVTFTVAATGEGLTYQWQFKAPNGEWSNNNFKTASMTFNPAALWRNGYQYRCIVTDKNGSKVTSNAATLTVQAASAVKITTQPQSKTVKANESVTFTVAATGEGLTYQWQVRANSNSGWSNNSYKTASMTFNPAELWRNGYQYRCVVTDKNGSKVTSNVATLTVEAAAPAIIITTQPQSVTTTADGMAMFTVAAQGEGLTYQWQYRTGANGKWYDNAVKTSTMTFISVGNWRNGYQYRCVVKDQYGNSVASNAATLIVVAAPPVAITGQPQNVTTTADGIARFTVVATGEGLVYQWQYKAPNGSWTNNSSKTATLTFNPAGAWRNGYQYRCIVVDKDGNTVISDVATLTVR